MFLGLAGGGFGAETTAGLLAGLTVGAVKSNSPVIVSKPVIDEIGSERDSDHEVAMTM